MQVRTAGAGDQEQLRDGGISYCVARLLALSGIVIAGILLSSLPSAYAALDQSDGASASSTYYEDALVLADEGELNAAVIQLKNSLGRDPGHLAARLLLGEVYTKLGFARAAIDAFETAIALGADDNLVVVPLFRAHLLSRNYQKILADIDLNTRPDAIRADLLIIRGHARLELGNYGDAEKDFNEAGVLAPRGSAPLVGKALVRFNRGDYSLAETDIETAIEFEGDDATAWFVKGEIKRARSINSLAIESYSRALDINPFHYKARLARAALSIDAGQYAKASADLDMLDARNHNDPQISYFRALIMLHDGQWQNAEETLDNALAFAESQGSGRRSDNPQFTLLAGVVRLLKGDQEQAYRLLSNHVDLVPDDPAGRMILGRVLIMMNEPARALSVLAPVRRLSPESPEFYGLMGIAHMRMGDYSDATDYLDRAISYASDAAPFQMEIARMHIREGEEAGARERLMEVLNLDSGSIEANYILAYLEINNRNYAAAQSHAREMMRTSPQNPTGYNLDGIILLSQGNIPEASAAFEKARELSPLFFSAVHNLAQLDLARGRLDLARSRYEALLEGDIKDIRSMIELVKIAKYEGEWAEAIERLEKVRSLQPDAWQFWMELADLYLQIGNEESASGIVEHLARIAPDDVGVVVAQGRAMLVAGNNNDARRTFGRAAVYAKDNPEVLREIAKYMVEAGGLDEAEDILQSGLRAAPDHLETHVSLVALYANQNRFDDAGVHAEYVRKTWPKDSLGYMLAGDIHMRKGAWVEALRAYEKGVELEETPALALRAYQATIVLHPDGKEQHDAMVRLREFSERNPGNRVIEQTLASALNRSGDREGARDLLQRLLSQDPEDIIVLNNLAILYNTVGDPQALDMARRAYALDPEEPAVLDTLGWVLNKAGEPAMALEYLREASARAHGLPEIHYHLAVTLNGLGRKREALREVTIALESKTPFDGRMDAEALAASLARE